MKFDQLAYIGETEGKQARIKTMLGLPHAYWTDDNVTMKSWCMDDVAESTAHLLFNTTHNPGMQLELIRFKSGPNWHERFGINHANVGLIVSHHGFHLEDDEPWPDLLGAQLVQITRTIQHTAIYLTKETSPGFGQTYEYRIYHMGNMVFWKFIKRIPKEKRGKDLPMVLR